MNFKPVKKVLLCLGSVILTLISVEPFFRSHFQNLSLASQESLETCVRPLAQISKKNILPHNYIAILGDSYAEGAGDWYIQLDRRKHRPFQASHILYEKRGQDVVTFGSSGTGPLRYVLANLPSSFIYINSMAFLSLEKPDKVIIYFYEGNDINDTLRILRRDLSPSLDPNVVFDEAKIDQFLDDYEREELHLRRARNFQFIYNLQSAVFMFRCVVTWYKFFKDGDPYPKELVPPGQLYKIKVGPNLVAIPDGLHGPEIGKSDEELKMGIFLYKKCIERLRQQFPDSQYGIVYIPAPYSVYRFADDEQNQKSKAFSKLVSMNSDKICAMVKAVADELKIPFVDSRPRLRAHAERRIIHGPYDWKHFNKLGYEIFAEDLSALLDRLEQEAKLKSDLKAA